VRLVGAAGDEAGKRSAPPKPIGWSGVELSGGVFTANDPGNHPDLTMELWLGDTSRTGVAEQMLTDPAISASADEWVERAQNADWTVKPADPDDPDCRMHAEFVRRMLFEESKTRWMDTVGNATMAVIYGCALAEPIYRYDARDETPTYDLIEEIGRRPRWEMTDRYDIGHHVLDDVAVRLPRSVSRWHQLPDGAFGGIYQYPRTDDTDNLDPEEILIPAENLCLWTYGSRGSSNWMGTGRYRASYFLWRARQTLMRTGVIAAERFGVGVPIAKQTEESFRDRQGHAEDWRSIQQQLARYRGGSQAWLAVTHGIDVDIKEASFTSAQHILDLYNAAALEIHILGGTQALVQGTQKVGTYSLAETQASEFRATLNPWLGTVADVVNTTVVRKLIDLNWPDVKHYPRVTVGDQEDGSTKDDAEVYQILVNSGMPTQPEDWDLFREQRNWPALTAATLGHDEEPEAEEDADDEEVVEDGDEQDEPLAASSQPNTTPAMRVRLLAESRFDARASRFNRQDATERISRDLHDAIGRAVLDPFLKKVSDAIADGDAKTIDETPLPGVVALRQIESRGLRNVQDVGRLEVKQEIERQDDPAFREDMAAALAEWRGIAAQGNPSGLENVIDEIVRDPKKIAEQLALAASTTAKRILAMIDDAIASFLQTTPTTEWTAEAIRTRVLNIVTPGVLARGVAQDVNTVYDTARAEQARKEEAEIAVYTLNPEIGVNGPHEPCPACVDTASGADNPAVVGSEAEARLVVPNPECHSSRSGILTCWCSKVYVTDPDVALDVVEGF